MSLYSELVAAGETVTNHESDLYIRCSDTAREIINAHGFNTRTLESFRSQVDGCWNWDIPFAYDPWWEARLRKES